MARARPEPWSDSQVAQAKGLMMSLALSDDEPRATMCDVMECAPSDLDWLCKQAFGLSFASAKKKFERVGKARLRSALFKAAEDCNRSALDLLAREHLGYMGPVERRKAKSEAKSDKEPEIVF